MTRSLGALWNAAAGGRLDWEQLASLEFIARLHETPQEPSVHAEGDVGVHTRMVLEAMLADPPWARLDIDTRALLLWAALLHDVGKPDCTRTEDGRIRSPGHAAWGAILARRILWRLEVPFAARETICNLVRSHTLPFWLLEGEDPRERIARLTQTTPAAHLALLAGADARGRTCQDQARLFEAVELFRELAIEHDCLEQPYRFPSDHARFSYLAGRHQDPGHAPHESFRCEVVLLSGLPGAGKDHWIRDNLGDWPVVSLDALRAELDVDPADPQGTVVAAARERARELLRQGRSFAWNGTNLSRRIRGQCLRLFADYGARVRIVYVEAPEPMLRAQNRARRAAVPERVIDALLDRWEVPDLTEAHEVTYAVRAPERDGRNDLPRSAGT